MARNSQPSQTLSPLPFLTDTVHAVVPIAASNQRQAMAADRQTGVQGAGAMLVKVARPPRDGRLEEAVALARRQHLARQKWHDFLEHVSVAGHLDVMRCGVGKPDAVVRDPRAHSLAGVRQPPVLNVVFDELAARGP